MSSIELNMLKGGINRLRTKGGVDPSSLYDLLNGYVDQNGNAVSRPGTHRIVALPAGTKGLCAFHGTLVVFSNVAVTIDTMFRCEVLTDPNDATQPIKTIHFAAPFMGFLYVVAEFGNGDVYHFWLQSSGAWSADHVYMEGDIVEPTVPNGIAYEATGDDHPAAWQPSKQYAVGDEVQPTVYNGFKYRLIEADGENPSSGQTEPTWLMTEGALVYEDMDTTTAPPPADNNGTPGDGRYDNLPGYKQGMLTKGIAP